MDVSTLNSSQNPFSDYGTIVEGERFIGRKNEIASIHSRVLGNNYGNLSIVGLPRIGKSSLVWNALLIQKSHLLSTRKIIVEQVSLGMFDSANELYEAIITKIIRVISQFDEDLFASYLKMANATICKDNMVDLFFLLRMNGYRSIIIFDEFDYCSNLFQISDFQFLRELSTMPDVRICLVTISRNTLQELEIKSGGISNFYGVFTDLRLGFFHEVRDEPLYWDWVEQTGILVTESYRQEVLYYAGRHPFLMDLLNYYVFCEAVNDGQTGDDMTERINAGIRDELWSQYNKILDVTKEENLQRALIQEIVGPVIDVTTEQVVKLLKYDLLRVSNNEERQYKTFSQHFAEYLVQKELEFDIWPLWNTAEQSMRDIIHDYLVNKYDEQWVESFIEKNPKQKANIESFQKIMLDNKRKFGERASDNLIRYTYPLDMWNTFIQTDWTYFQRILGGGISDWKERFLLLGKIRNPLAHSNKEFINPEEIDKAKMICELIIKGNEQRYS